MKLIVEEQDKIIKAIKAEYTPTEALIINLAMRRYVDDDETHEDDRAIMEQMLKVKPTYVDVTESENEGQRMETEKALKDQEANEVADRLSDLFLYLNRNANEEDSEIVNSYDVSFELGNKLRFKAHVEFTADYIDKK